MTINFEYYKVFFFVARELNITHAAEKLYITQSAVSKTISALEERLGVRLFTREKKGVRLTPEGEYLFNEIAPIIEDLFRAENRFSYKLQAEQGSIRIAANTDITWFILNTLIEKFRITHPDTVFTVSIIDSHYMEQTLKRGIVDLGFVLTPRLDPERLTIPTFSRSLQNSSNLSTIPLTTYTDIVLADAGTASNQIMAQRMLSKAELASFPLIITRDNDYYLKEIGRDFQECDIVMMDVKTRIEMAKRNMGIIFLPYFCVQEELSNNQLIQLDSEEINFLQRDFFAVKAKDKNLPLMTTLFAEMARQEIQSTDL